MVSHILKFMWVGKRRLGSINRITENQFEFMSDWSTKEAISMIWLLTEIYRNKQKNLYNFHWVREALGSL